MLRLYIWPQSMDALATAYIISWAALFVDLLVKHSTDCQHWQFCIAIWLRCGHRFALCLLCFACNWRSFTAGETLSSGQHSTGCVTIFLPLLPVFNHSLAINSYNCPLCLYLVLCGDRVCHCQTLCKLTSPTKSLHDICAVSLSFHMLCMLLLSNLCFGQLLLS